MSPKIGRPTENKKTERLEIRLTLDEAMRLKRCAEKMGKNKTAAINEGLKLLDEKLGKK